MEYISHIAISPKNTPKHFFKYVTFNLLAMIAPITAPPMPETAMGIPCFKINIFLFDIGNNGNNGSWNEKY